MKTSEHEVIFAIVNSGFAEDVMEVAREQGVRGGTILNARGVVREDAAAFFGITLHADKEILMMVVEKSLRDKVLNAIYKEMGMAKRPRASPSACRCPMWPGLPRCSQRRKSRNNRKTPIFETKGRARTDEYSRNDRRRGWPHSDLPDGESRFRLAQPVWPDIGCFIADSQYDLCRENKKSAESVHQQGDESFGAGWPLWMYVFYGVSRRNSGNGICFRWRISGVWIWKCPADGCVLDSMDAVFP